MLSPKKDNFQPRIPVSANDHVLINLNEKVGKWTYGDYYKGTSKKLNKDLMVKMVDLTKYPLKQKSLETEIALLKKLKSCPYVVEFMEYKYYQKTLVIVTESYNAGDLKTYIEKNGPIPEETALRILVQLVCGLKALHTAKYIHCAVRPENILLNEENGRLTAKLSNFIFAKTYDGDNAAKFPIALDSKYLAPEVLKENIFDPTSDIWSLGVLYYEMLFGVLPWDGKTKEELRDNIINKKLEFANREGISDTSIDFIYRCLHRDLKKRINWKDITDHRLLFRALFMNDDGTFKLYNDEFKECSPSRRNIMFGNRQAITSFPGSPASAKTSNKSAFAKQQTLDLNTSHLSASSNFALKPTSPFHVMGEKSNPDSPGLKNEDGSSPIHIERSPSPIAHRGEGVAPQEDEVVIKKPDAEFYSNYMSKVGETDDFYLAKFLNKDPLDNKGPFSKKTFVKPFKWLANKAEVVSEIYELAQRNREHCTYERVVQLLNEETTAWNTLGLVSAMQKQFAESVESSSKLEEDKTVSWPKNVRQNHSITKKEKSHKTAALIEDIVASLTNSAENYKANNEEMIQIAANLKILREYDEIGDNVMRELDVMKNALIVFYRKRDHGHIKYLLTIRNLA